MYLDFVYLCLFNFFLMLLALGIKHSRQIGLKCDRRSKIQLLSFHSKLLTV